MNEEQPIAKDLHTAPRSIACCWQVCCLSSPDFTFPYLQSLLTSFGLDAVKHYDGSDLQGLPGAAAELESRFTCVLLLQGRVAVSRLQNSHIHWAGSKVCCH